LGTQQRLMLGRIGDVSALTPVHFLFAVEAK